MPLSYQEWKTQNLDDLIERFHSIYGNQLQESGDFMEYEYSKYVASLTSDGLPK